LLKAFNAAEPPALWRAEWSLAVAVATCALLWANGDAVYHRFAGPVLPLVVLIGLCAVILGAALAVVRHAEHLAATLGEPLGTLILTLSVTFIEVMSITAIMLHGENNPTLVRDTLLAVIMIVMNGMVGLSLLLGAWRNREQSYNLQGANAYLAVIIPLASMTLIMPDYTETTSGPTLSFAQETTLAFMSVSLYAAFVALQTGRHRGFFILGGELAEGESEIARSRAALIAFHFAMLAAYLAPVVYLAEQLAHPADYLTETLHAPEAIVGVIIAALVATPEAIGAARAGLANRLQRSVNILFGSALSSIGLTVPVMLLVSHWIGRPLILGVEHANMFLLLLTLGLSVVTFSSGRTNVLHGAVHLLLFLTFLLLMAQG
jgi:Ca2+:H+ antiporter